MNFRDTHMEEPKKRKEEGRGKTEITGTPLNREFRLEDFREARLFTTSERATLTFYLGTEVASIHFDKNRMEIFYKGHNVKNMTLNSDQWLALKNFSTFMTREKVNPAMVQAYDEALSQVFPKR